MLQTVLASVPHGSAGAEGGQAGLYSLPKQTHNSWLLSAGYSVAMTAVSQGDALHRCDQFKG